MCLVWLSDNRLFAVACVRMWETQVITEDSAREFPQCRLWPRSVFRQPLFCVCASALHTPSQRTGEHYRYTAERESDTQTGKSNCWRPSYNFIFIIIVISVLSHKLSSSRKSSCGTPVQQTEVQTATCWTQMAIIQRYISELSFIVSFCTQIYVKVLNDSVPKRDGFLQGDPLLHFSAKHQYRWRSEDEKSVIAAHLSEWNM